VPPPTGARPSAPQALLATQPAVGSGVVLSWQPPASGPVTGYRVYRSTSPFALGFLAGVGNVTQYNDTTAAPGVLYYYTVTAVNSAGEGPASNLNRMVGK
jgi:fibronectin type 3 domain-containing protein